MKQEETGSDELSILDERARKLAMTDERVDQRSVDVQVAVVAVGEERFGIPVDAVMEVIRVPPIARMSGLPDWMPGIVQVRGELMTVLDLGLWLRVQGGRKNDFLVILKGPEGLLGLLVESVVDFRDIYEDEITQTLVEQAVAAGRPLWATTKDLLTILDTERLFSSPEIVVKRSI